MSIGPNPGGQLLIKMKIKFNAQHEYSWEKKYKLNGNYFMERKY
jgi:hypothetical protein